MTDQTMNGLMKILDMIQDGREVDIFSVSEAADIPIATVRYHVTNRQAPSQECFTITWKCPSGYRKVYTRFKISQIGKDRLAKYFQKVNLPESDPSEYWNKLVLLHSKVFNQPRVRCWLYRQSVTRGLPVAEYRDYLLPHKRRVRSS